MQADNLQRLVRVDDNTSLQYSLSNCTHDAICEPISKEEAIYYCSDSNDA